MKVQVSVDELSEHIRAEARRQRGDVTPPGPGTESTQGASLPSSPPSFAPPPARAVFLAGIAAEASRLVAKARQKVAVNARVPKFLRPFYRNQGGYNGVVLETLDVLCDVNQQLVAENGRLREHLIRQEEWMRHITRGWQSLHTRLAILEHQRGAESLDADAVTSAADSAPPDP